MEPVKKDELPIAEAEIQDVYSRLGLTTGADRRRFAPIEPERPRPTFDVVISTTSQPFSN